MVKINLPQTIAELVPEVIAKYGKSMFDEQYPHIVKNLCMFWGSDFFNEYVQNLIAIYPTSNRPIRQGFPFEALKELRVIVDAHAEKFPQYKMSINIWA